MNKNKSRFLILLIVPDLFLNLCNYNILLYLLMLSVFILSLFIAQKVMAKLTGSVIENEI